MLFPPPWGRLRSKIDRVACHRPVTVVVTRAGKRELLRKPTGLLPQEADGAPTCLPLTFGLGVASLWPPCCLRLPPYCLVVASLMPPPCLLVASQLPPSCLPVVFLLPPGYIPAASLLPPPASLSPPCGLPVSSLGCVCAAPFFLVDILAQRSISTPPRCREQDLQRSDLRRAFGLASASGRSCAGQRPHANR